eukprot:434116-Heterocapsa_arctica.AAC.1
MVIARMPEGRSTTVNNRPTDHVKTTAVSTTLDYLTYGIRSITPFSDKFTPLCKIIRVLRGIQR